MSQFSLTLVTAIQFSSSNLLVGTNYQLQVMQSGAWTDVSPNFVAMTNPYVAYAPGLNRGLSYRLVAPPVPTAATATPTVFNGFVVAATVTSGSYGYTNPPSVQILGGGGSGAQAVAVLSNGVVTSVTILSAGAGYSSTPTIVIAPPPFGMAVSIAPAFGLNCLGLTAGLSYQVQSSPNLSGWTNFTSSFVASSSSNSFFFSTNARSLFFRLLYLP